MTFPGKFIIVFGPSGSGKNELMLHTRRTFLDVLFPFSYTTRAQRSSIESASYRFVSVEEFKERIQNNEFLEWAEFAGNFYGTLQSEVEEGLKNASILVKEIEVQGIQQILEKLPRENLLLVFIDAGSWETLERRARARGSITEEAIALRKERYVEEMRFVEEVGPDIRIPNPDGQLEAAKSAFEEVIRSAQKNALG